MESPTIKEAPLFFLNKFLPIIFIVSCATNAMANDSDLGTTKITASNSPDITEELFWRSMHPYLKRGTHNYCHSKMQQYPKTFYTNFVKEKLQEDPSGKYFIRFYIYQCAWNNKSCDNDWDFDKDQRIKFDVHYNFDC